MLLKYQNAENLKIGEKSQSPVVSPGGHVKVGLFPTSTLNPYAYLSVA